MVRIAGINLPNDKRIAIALTYIYGIGPTTALKILAQAKVSPETRTKNLTDAEANKLREIVEKSHRVEGDLRGLVISNIKRLKDIGSYRGSRHAKHLPVRGQRTKTNSRTAHGNTRRTMMSGRKKGAEKT